MSDEQFTLLMQALVNIVEQLNAMRKELEAR